MEFTLDARLCVDEGNAIEESHYKLAYTVNLLKVNDKQAVFYDKELKMHFEKPSAITYLYEVETEVLELSMARPVEKSEDFNRRLFYRYDWIQPHLNTIGEIIGIENQDELRQSWPELKKAILKDYMGYEVINYLKHIDKEFAPGKIPAALSFRQYLHFGLLFPKIPLNHGRDWNNKRTVELSEYEQEKFEELIIFQKTNDGLRTYSISGSKLEEGKSRLIEYEGKVIVPENEFFPLSTVIKIIFLWGQTTISWHFILSRKEDVKI